MKIDHDYNRNIPWTFHKDQTWLNWDIVDLNNDHLKSFMAFGHQKEPIQKMKKSKVVQHHHRKILWNFHKYQTWLNWDIVDLKKYKLKSFVAFNNQKSL